MVVVVYAGLVGGAYAIGPATAPAAGHVQDARPGPRATSDWGTATAATITMIASSSPATGAVSFTDDGPVTGLRLISTRVSAAQCDASGAAATVTGAARVVADGRTAIVTFRLDLGVASHRASLRVQATDGYDSGTAPIVQGQVGVTDRGVTRQVNVRASTATTRAG